MSTAPYLAHWGLAEGPFRLEPDPRFAYERADHREGLARILFGITQLGGLVVITGEIGAGKTLLAQTLRQTLDGEGFPVAEVANPPRTAAALLAAALPAMDAPKAGGSTARLSGLIRGRLGAAEREGYRIVIAIDEAQRLDPRALDEVRLLTNPGAEGPGRAGRPARPARADGAHRAPAPGGPARGGALPPRRDDRRGGRRLRAPPHPRGRRRSPHPLQARRAGGRTPRPAASRGWSTCCSPTPSSSRPSGARTRSARTPSATWPRTAA